MTRLRRGEGLVNEEDRVNVRSAAWSRSISPCRRKHHLGQGSFKRAAHQHPLSRAHSWGPTSQALIATTHIPSQRDLLGCLAHRRRRWQQFAISEARRLIHPYAQVDPPARRSWCRATARTRPARQVFVSTAVPERLIAHIVRTRVPRCACPCWSQWPGFRVLVGYLRAWWAGEVVLLSLCS